ncbi:head-tail joining protein [Massilia endophytica]|uniref:head-tail joining protein n=1 Tax=Massilia endophytica TaxID=2899220 RepID=UPI001E3D0C9E|nr:hypothetical protein [Massilia endophytica]UGQ45084.1 hypothetical protein LSQ66_14920 [Massilia endophytica]
MFDQLEARLHLAALAKLANARVVIGGEEVPVVFDAQFKVGMVGTIGMGAAAPQMILASDKVPESFVGTSVTVNGAVWRVADCQPDGTSMAGLTTVLLEKAA